MRLRIASFFALLVACGGAAGAEPTTPERMSADASPERAPLPLAFGSSSGALSEDHPTDRRGAHVERYALELDPSRRVRIVMRSPEIDPQLELEGPGGVRLRNDDAFPGTLDAMLDFIPPAPGTYILRATTAGAGQRGAYELSVEARGLEGIGGALPLGGELSARLGAFETPGLPGSWLHFEGQGGSIVRLRVTSTDFDTVATLIGPGGQVWTNDDANDLGPDGSERALDSTIVAALPQTGVYQLVVTPYALRGGGGFRVRSTFRPPVVRGPDGERPDGLAGAEGGGRVLGLYAGITEYRDLGRLYGCADDARLLGEAMRASGLQRQDEQIVLPDGLASREGMLGGIAQLARDARPEDVVIVFFSGHGGQQPTDDPREIDGHDEYIVLSDGRLTDDELVGALDAIGAGTLILAIDACNSGGFAEDFVTRPGRIGIFSSDADVLSEVAEPHRAGGYLSWHLRRGVLGEADHRPRDGVLFAGELTDYLYQGFVDDHGLMNRGDDPSQRLVIRRGGVPWPQVLWVYPRNADLELPPIPDLPLVSAPLR